MSAHFKHSPRPTPDSDVPPADWRNHPEGFEDGYDEEWDDPDGDWSDEDWEDLRTFAEIRRDRAENRAEYRNSLRQEA